MSSNHPINIRKLTNTKLFRYGFLTNSQRCILIVTKGVFCVSNSIKLHDRLETAMFFTFLGGFLDAYCVILRGGVFASAQTGNIIFLGVSVATRKWADIPEKLLPIIFFAIGTIIVQITKRKYAGDIGNRWRLWLLGLQILVLIIIGAVPLSVPNLPVTTVLSLSMAVQLSCYTTVSGLPYANAFTTGNYRKFIENTYLYCVTKESVYHHKMKAFGLIVFCFVLGTMSAALLIPYLSVHTAWIAAGLLTVFFVLQFWFTQRALKEKIMQKKA